jgi:hypothetical protein
MLETGCQAMEGLHQNPISVRSLGIEEGKQSLLRSTRAVVSQRFEPVARICSRSRNEAKHSHEREGERRSQRWCLITLLVTLRYGASPAPVPNSEASSRQRHALSEMISTSLRSADKRTPGPREHIPVGHQQDDIIQSDARDCHPSSPDRPPRSRVDSAFFHDES